MEQRLLCLRHASSSIATAQQLQKRREHAIKLLAAGKLPAVVARAVSASRSSVSRWRDAFERARWGGLRAKPTPGRSAALNAQQKQRLLALLLKGALAAGYHTDLWTLQRIRRLIKEHFHVTYHAGHVWKLLRALGWSCQKPERRAIQRDEAAIAHWKRYRWPQIRRQADQWGATLVFLDESGFLLIPNLKRTWAPSGQTPTVRYSFKHDKLSAITALAITPKRKRIGLYLRFQRRNFKAPNVRRFLQHLLRHMRGPIIILWDGARIHRDHRVNAWCDKHPRLHLEEFPGYAPELNPAEYVWCQSDAALANSLPEELDDLHAMLFNTKRRLARSQALLWACVQASDLPWK